MTEEQLKWTAEAKTFFEKYVLSKQIKQDGISALPDDQLEVLSKLTSETTMIICQNQLIPSGFVIVGQTTNFNCSPELNNAWIIKRPAEKETICKVSPMPVGYVIVGQTTNFSCSQDLANAWFIRLPEAEGMVVCKASPLPDGYIIVAQTTDFSCSTDLYNAWVIRKITI